MKKFTNIHNYQIPNIYLSWNEKSFILKQSQEILIVT